MYRQKITDGGRLYLHSATMNFNGWWWWWLNSHRMVEDPNCAVTEFRNVKIWMWFAQLSLIYLSSDRTVFPTLFLRRPKYHISNGRGYFNNHSVRYTFVCLLWLRNVVITIGTKRFSLEPTRPLGQNSWQPFGRLMVIVDAFVTWFLSDTYKNGQVDTPLPLQPLQVQARKSGWNNTITAAFSFGIAYTEGLNLHTLNENAQNMRTLVWLSLASKVA